MGKINILQPNVFNMIAAGEVVERPASVVKELVENSIDAGATSVDIYVEEGGIKRIRVSDNGTGIHPDDLRHAFLPHATSKLREIFDLDTISTLGFRGEALASIASVSEVTLVSKSQDCGNAAKISLSGGDIISESMDGRAQGTMITVDNLFFNTPARIKFLKKASSEMSAVADIVAKIAMANPSIAFELSTPDGTVFTQEGGSLLDSMISIYPDMSSKDLLKVEYAAANGIRVSGYTSATDRTASTRARQTVVVNGRIVESLTVQTAVEKAYQDYLMKRNYPIYVLDIIIPFEDVDVNVHPAKTEVRFRHSNAVFSAVFHAVEDAIKANSALDSTPIVKTVAPSYDQSRIDTSAFYGESSGNYDRTLNNLGNSSDNSFDIMVKPDKAALKSSQVGFYGTNEVSNIAKSTDFAEKSANIFAELLKAEPITHTFDEDFAQSSNKGNKYFDGHIVGQLFDSFIIVEKDDFAYIIDQHAAHERVLYDKLKSELKIEFSQSLLIPYKIKLYGKEAEYFDKLIPSLNKMGFDIEKNTGNYLVYSMPMLLADMDFKKFLGELFDGSFDAGEISAFDLLKERICQKACKAAIKAGDPLTREQIEKTLETFTDEDGNLPSKCPHGRPAVIKLSKRDFEKMFKRIV